MKWLLLVPFAVWALWVWRSAGYREVEGAVDPVDVRHLAALRDETYTAINALPPFAGGDDDAAA